MEILSLIFVTGIQYVSFTTATRLQSRRSRGRKKFAFCSVELFSGGKTMRLTLTTHLHLIKLSRDKSWRLEWGLNVGLPSPPSSAKINYVCCCAAAPVCLHGLDRCNFSFYMLHFVCQVLWRLFLIRCVTSACTEVPVLSAIRKVFIWGITYPSTRGGSNTPSRWQVSIHAQRLRYSPSTAGRQHRSFSNHRWTQYTDARYAPVRWTKQPHQPNTSQRRNTSISDTRGCTLLTVILVEYYSVWTRSRHL
jgi:hypothetical protein